MSKCKKKLRPKLQADEALGSLDNPLKSKENSTPMSWGDYNTYLFQESSTPAADGGALGGDIVVGEQLNSMIQNIMDMGYERSQVGKKCIYLRGIFPSIFFTLGQ